MISDIVEKDCQSAAGYSYVLNGRFKGGWTTRYYGDPTINVHAIQMELSQKTYMQEQSPWTFLPETANKIRPHLSRILESLTKIRLKVS